MSWSPTPAYTIEYGFSDVPHDGNELAPDPQEFETLHIYGDKTVVPILGKKHQDLPNVNVGSPLHATRTNESDGARGAKGCKGCKGSSAKAPSWSKGKNERRGSAETVTSQASDKSSTVAGVVKRYWTHVKKKNV